jgi:hypothetical protein
METGSEKTLQAVMDLFGGFSSLEIGGKKEKGSSCSNGSSTHACIPS